METKAQTLLPEQFGSLQGVRILSTGTIIAQPFAADLAAAMGAEVIQIERPGTGDAVWRNLEFQIKGDDGSSIAAGWAQHRRNTMHSTLDLGTAKGKEIFLKLIPLVDIWMESSIPGTFSEWGLDDETILKINPSIVITHVSGYGQDGDPDYLDRASYDFIGQGFGGMMNLIGFPDPNPPVRAAPWTGDFITALFCLWSSLSGYIYAQRTGKGQVIDLAQFEAVHQVLAGTMLAYYELGLDRQRSGNKMGLLQPYDCYQAKDGWVNVAAIGARFKNLCVVLGLDPADERWHKAADEVESIEGIEFDAILRGWLEDHTVQEAVDTLNAAKVACCAIMTPKDMAEDAHYKLRNVHIEWEDIILGRKVKGTGVTPKFSLTPGKIWRGSVPLGYDNELIYSDFLGITPAELKQLEEQGVI